MTDAPAPPPARPLVPIPANEVTELVALALNLTKGRKREEAIAREANSVVADRLLEYFAASGIVLMRPAPRHIRTIRIPTARRWRGSGMPPDGPREPYRPEPRIEPSRRPDIGFTAGNTSGLTARELVALNRALGRLMSTGLDEHSAKLAIDTAVREWLKPKDAADADLERLLAWR